MEESEIEIQLKDEEIDIDVKNIYSVLNDDYSIEHNITVCKNEMVQAIEKQIDGWKKSLDDIIVKKYNKTILLYHCFVILELCMKGKFFKIKNILDYSHDVDGLTKTKKINHNITQFTEELINSDEIIDSDKRYFRIIGEKVELLRNFTYISSDSCYPDLRYNLNRNGCIIDRDIRVSNELIKVAKGVIDIDNI